MRIERQEEQVQDGVCTIKCIEFKYNAMMEIYIMPLVSIMNLIRILIIVENVLRSVSRPLQPRNSPDRRLGSVKPQAILFE